MAMYEPTSEELQAIKARISSASWKRRVERARKLERKVLAIHQRVEAGESQEMALRSVVDKSQRSRLMRALVRYREEGFEGLIDRRTPREPVSVEQRMAIEMARRTDPRVPVLRIIELVKQQCGAEVSSATVKRVLKKAGLERPVGRPSGSSTRASYPLGTKVEELGAAGFELLRAAEAETGAVDELVDTLLALGQELPEPGEVSEEERALRNEKGQLTARYNEAQRKAPGAVVGPAYRTMEEKSAERDLGRLKLRSHNPPAVERRVWALLGMPVLTKGNRFDELYGPQGEYLRGMCGYPYMPETLRKTVTELALVGAGEVLQQVHSATWHRISQERWERGYRASVVYVDNTAKPLWSKQYVKSAKVATTGRVQPALVSTYVHSGAGAPIHFETYSGTAPLAPRVLSLLKRVEAQSECPVGRLTVIDGECCSAGLLAAFKKDERDLVTPLPATIAKPERIQFGRGSAPQPFRDGDTIREGTVELRDSHQRNVVVQARAIVIEHWGQPGDWTALVTLADPEQWSARQLATLYFERWPNQESFFRQGNKAVALQRVQGYGKRVVANTSVVTKLDEQEARIDRKRERLAQLEQEREQQATALAELDKRRRRKERYADKRQERVDAAMQTPRVTRKGQQAVEELKEAHAALGEMTAQREQLQAKQKQLEQQRNRAQGQVQRWEAERAKLESRREILEADVSKDTLLTTLKLTLAMLTHFVVVEYFPHRPMLWATFLSRLALLPGRRETTGDAITTYIQANPRDREMMAALEQACENVNQRQLNKGGKTLRFVVVWPSDQES
jgi:hypothetical protein